MGADDYVAKPFSPRDAAGAREGGAAARPRKEAEATTPARPRVRHRLGPPRVALVGKTVGAHATEFRLLHFLALHVGRVFTRDQIVRRRDGRR